MKKIIHLFLLFILLHKVGFGICTPVSITTQPTNQNDSIPGHAHFTIGVTGTAPYNYYWYKNGTLVDSTISSASASNTYNTPSLTMADSNATYYCIITNCAGVNTITTNTVHLVCIPVSISIQPLSQAFTAGNVATISFSVTVNGTPPFTYKWYKNGSTLVKTTTDTSGATSIYSFYANPIVQSMNGWTYDVVITNCHTGIGSGGGNQVTSAGSVLTVGCPATINTPVFCGNYPCTNQINLSTLSGWGSSADYVFTGGINGYIIQGFSGATYTNQLCSGGYQYFSVSILAFGCIVGSGSGGIFLDTVAHLAQPFNRSICSGQLVSVTPYTTETCYNIVPRYTHTAPSYITGFAGNGHGSINDVLINTGTTVGTVVYTITTGGSCPVNTVSFTVTVYPYPLVTVDSSAICSGQQATLTASGAATYVWSAGAASSGVNTAVASPPSTQVYSVIGSTNGCKDTAYSLVTVNPSPTVTVNSPSLCIVSIDTLVAHGAVSYVWSAGAIPIGVDSAFVNPTVTTSYTVTGTSANGCTDTAVSVVTINPVPSQPSPISGAVNVCGGIASIYSVVDNPNNATYTWTLPTTWLGTSDSSLIATTTDSIGGIISVVANNRCGSSVPQTLAVNGSSMPVLTFAPLGTICDNAAAFVLNSATPTGGTYAGAGVNNNVFTPASVSSGTYFITYTYVSGACTVVDSVPITIDLCTGINQLSNNDGIIIAPNPFTLQTTITFNEEQKHTIIKVTDVLGKEIKTVILCGARNLILEKEEMKAGIYFVQITNENNIINRKVIIQ